MSDSDDKSNAMVAFVRAVDEAHGFRDAVRRTARASATSLVAYVEGIDETYGLRSRLTTARDNVTGSLLQRGLRLRKSMRARARSLARDLLADDLQRPERAQINSDAVPRDVLISVGELDVVTAEARIGPGAVAVLPVDLRRSNFFGPMAVRLLVTSADNFALEQRIEVRYAEINQYPQLGAMIPSDTWAAPPGSGVRVRWGIFSMLTFCESLNVTLHNPNAIAVRAVLNIYGDELRSVPPGVQLAAQTYTRDMADPGWPHKYRR